MKKDIPKKEQERIKKILKILREDYPDTKPFLKHKNALELLISTILSAQCTDKMVNKVTGKLFKKYKTVKDYANAKQSEFEQDVRSTGFYRNKTKNIIATAKLIQEEFKGKVPNTMEDLIQLPGVARKTANLVLTHSFNKIEGIAVDTHVKKAAYKLGLTDNHNPNKIELDLMEKIPKKEWGNINHRFVEHGRDCTYKKQGCRLCKFVVR